MTYFSNIHSKNRSKVQVNKMNLIRLSNKTRRAGIKRINAGSSQLGQVNKVF